MKIGLVLPEAPQYSETFFKYKIRNLTDAGFEVTVFSNKPGDDSDEIKCKIKSAYPVYEESKFKQLFFIPVILLKTFLLNYKNSRRLFELERGDGISFSDSLKSVYINSHILSEKVDRLHFGFMTMTLRRENTAKAIGAEMSVSLRGYDVNVYPLKNPGCYVRAWKKTDKVHTISDYLRDKALKTGLPEDVPFEKISPAIDLKQFSLKSEPGKINKKLNLLTVGRLNWIKDYETAISAVGKLKNRGAEVTYNIAGSGPELERLIFCAYQLGLEKDVIFHGKKSHGEINEMMEKADIYLQTSMQEGFCGSVLEAQAKGLLCVVSDADGLKENVIDEKTGWISEKRNPAAFADKIEMIMNLSEEKRKEIALNARRRIETDFNLEDQKERFINFFKP
ncbi:MAG TPA: glycosyltransferase family 4 protein [Ignavibacteria bacterium]|nr:glycosyltransferase family 4 protein [Ignavibacteria bacterium]HMR38815.1 glycosyltransferase family 4 protein [Ignavibacteria bacterium]